MQRPGEVLLFEKKKRKKKDASEDLVNVVRPLVGIGKEISEIDRKSVV